MSEFIIGGNEEGLSEYEKCAQLVWYFKEYYPITTDYDNWAARLPDRLCHAAIMQLGTAVDHSFPGTKGDYDVTISDNGITVQDPKITIYAQPHPEWGPLYTEMVWIPELVELASQASAHITFQPQKDAIAYGPGTELFPHYIFPKKELNKTLPPNTFYGWDVCNNGAFIITTPQNYRQRIENFLISLQSQQ